MLLTSNRTVMGDFVNGWPTKLWGWLAVVVLVAADATLVYQLIRSGFPS